MRPFRRSLRTAPALLSLVFFFFQAEDGIRDYKVTGVQTCALPILKPEYRSVRAFFTTRTTIVASPQQSKELVASRQPAIVIASSGMATGGRVIHHQIGRASCRERV